MKKLSEDESTFERIVSEPAILLEEGIESVEKLQQKVVNKKPFKVAEEYWNTLGPGLTTGAADDDPSGIATYSQTGSQYGFQLLWISWFTFPLMAVVQEMCARIGVSTGHGLAANIRRHYPPGILYILTALLFAANTFNIGADLGAMAAGAQLLYPSGNAALFVILFGIISLGLQIFTTYARYARYLKYLAFVLLAYIVSALMSHLDWHAVLRGFAIPTVTFSREQVFLICAILGTTISPYLFFWQTAQEVEESRMRRPLTKESWHPRVSSDQMGRIRQDVWSGMFFSNVVMFFIIAACAGTLFTHGITTIRTAADAALALRPFAGNAAFLLFAIGIVGTGFLAIPVLAGSTSYAIAESFGWKQGLYRKLDKAYSFYGIIIISVLIGIGLNFIGLDPIKALIYSAVANAIVAPFVLFFILRLSHSKEVMGSHTNSRTAYAIGWVAFGLMVCAGAAAILSTVL
jgi:NRAMP (natural resistance-associated macrophage protein)-like metal ion transporter